MHLQNDYMSKFIINNLTNLEQKISLSKHANMVATWINDICLLEKLSGIPTAQKIIYVLSVRVGAVVLQLGHSMAHPHATLEGLGLGPCCASMPASCQCA